MDLKTRLVEEMKEGMKAGDTERVGVVRMLRAAIKNKEIEKGKGASLSEDELLRVIGSAIKQRQEAIPFYEQGGRADLIEKEKKEVAFLETLLPPPFSEEEVQSKIAEAITQAGATTVKQMGEVMKILTPQLVGRADGKAVSEKVRARLTQGAL